jgi:uncharacterized protein
MDIEGIVNAMNSELYERFKTAVELRKWPNGERLSAEQIATCLNAIIAWESLHVPAQERVGYIPPKEEPCADDSHIHTRETPIKWQ